MILRRQAALGYSHVPSPLVVVQSFCGMLSRDSCLQLDTRKLHCTSGDVFEDLLAPNEPTAAVLGNARSATDTHCEPVSLNTGRLAAKEAEVERNSKLGNAYTEICQEIFNLESSLSRRRSLSAKLYG